MIKAFKLLKKLPSDVSFINSLFVSAFANLHGLNVETSPLLTKYKLTTNDVIFDFVKCIQGKEDGLEQLVHLFEFVISPADRIINGAIYTPAPIRKTIIDFCLNDFSIERLKQIRVCDISCGCGGFLMDVAQLIHDRTGKAFSDIYRENIYGIDIQDYSVERTKILLSMLALMHGESADFDFNILHADTLDYNTKYWNPKYSSFDVIVGNPPYVCSRKVSTETRAKIQSYDVCKSGHPDLYIPFFQIADNMLSDSGRLGYITMNTFLRSINGRSLRNFFSSNNKKIHVVDFRGHQIFNKKSAYTCLFFMYKGIKATGVEYMVNTNGNITDPFVFNSIPYENLDNKKGWNLNDKETTEQIEAIGTPIGKYCPSRHGIATLCNKIFIFRPIDEDNTYYNIVRDAIPFRIEKAICRNIVNSNKLNSKVNFESLIEKVIYPYIYDDNGCHLIDEDVLKNEYPETYAYLMHYKEKLISRDKKKILNYTAWYAFGRTQSLTLPRYKLFFPKFANKPLQCEIRDDKELLLYNGMAFVNDNVIILQVLKRILESRIFWNYLIKNAKPYSSDYYSLSGVDIKNFGIPQFDEIEINELLSIGSKNEIENWLSKYYGTNDTL